MKTLDLSRNLIDGRLTSAVCALAELETLKLRRNLLDGLPDCMGDLISLDDLDLAYNELVDVGPGTSAAGALGWTRYPSITLFLDYNNLKVLPELRSEQVGTEDWNCPMYISVRGNYLKALPETWGLAKWHRLYHLHVSDNKLKTLPASFSAALIELRSENNKLSEYPPMLASQKACEYFGFRMREVEFDYDESNKVIRNILLTSTEEDATFNPAHRAVTNIFLRNNKITSLPTTFGPRVNESSSATMELDLAYNRIETVSEAIGELEHLRKLDLQYNSIRTISEDITYARSIEKLKLAGNQLLDLPEGVGRKRRYDNTPVANPLQGLWLEVNSVSELPPSLLNASELEEVHLYANKCCDGETPDLPEAFDGLVGAGVVTCCLEELAGGDGRDEKGCLMNPSSQPTSSAAPTSTRAPTLVPTPYVPLAPTVACVDDPDATWFGFGCADMDFILTTGGHDTCEDAKNGQFAGVVDVDEVIATCPVTCDSCRENQLVV